MTTSAHVYTATVGGVPLSIRQGSRIMLDASAAPHVSSVLEVGSSDAAALAALDPRTSPAPRVIVTCSAGIPRAFDLHVRDRSIDHRGGTVTLALASDEGLLEDYAPLADDPTPRTYETSLRNLVGYVLGKAIPGATLEAGTTTANMTAYWSVSNLIVNPSFEVDGSGWVNSVNADIVVPNATKAYAGSKCGHWRQTAAGSSWIESAKMGVRAGRSYVASAYLSLIAGGAGTGNIAIRFYSGDTPLLTYNGASVAVSTAGWTRATHMVTAPPGATHAMVAIINAGAEGRYPAVDAVMFHEGTEVVPAFDGNTTDTATYTYDWESGANNSPSTRKPVVERLPEAFTWKAGQSALDFLHPLIQSQGFRLVCDEQRKWTLRDENYTADGALALRTGVNLTAADEAISRDGGVWFDARATRYTWTDSEGIEQERTDTYALTPTYSRLTLLEVNAPYPGPGRSEYAVRRAQGIGREVTLSTVSDWGARAEQNVSVILPDTPVQIGLTQSVSYDLSTDEMTVTTRTTDTPAGAINLLTGTVNALTGTVNAL